MSWHEAVASTLSNDPLLARLCFASLELLLLSVLLAALLRWRGAASPRLASLLWLIVLAKPIVSLSLGAPLSAVALRAPPIEARVERGEERASGEDLSVAADRSAEVAPAAAALDPVGSSPTPAESRASSRLRLPPFTPAQLLLAFWLGGVAVFAARYLFVRRRLARIVAGAAPVPASFAQRLADIVRQLGLERVPGLRATDALDSPALVGVLRPTLLLPRWMVAHGWSTSAEWALRHELSHYRWRDPLAIFVRDLATILFHFHPAAWWAARRHLEALELACDQDSLRDPSQAPAYAEGLYEILLRVQARRTAAPRCASLAMATRGRMARRVAALLEGAPARPLTRTAAAAAASVALVVFAFGFTLERGAAPAPAAALRGRSHAAETNLFLIGPLPGGQFVQICKAARKGGKFGDITGRGHQLKVYDDLFEDPANTYERERGDILVLLLTLAPEEQVPDKYADLLPVPWPKLRARLEAGESFEESGKARDLEVLALGAPDLARLETCVQGSKALARLLGAPVAPVPNLFLLGPLSSERFEQIVKAARGSGRVRDIWGRPHEEKTYDELLAERRRAGDLLVLFVTLDEEGQIPKKHADLLPSPWSKLRARLEHGETVEESRSTRDMEVLVLGAPDRARLEAFVLQSEKLSELLGAKVEEGDGHDHGGGGHDHGGHEHGGARPPDVFIMGSDQFQKVVDNTKRGTFSKTGRPHEERYYDEIFAPTPNRHDRSDGDLMVLLFSLETKDALPAKYHDLLPKPWAEIEAAMKKGETVELQGEARGLKVFVLAAPTQAALSTLIDKTAVLAPYRPEPKSGGLLRVLPGGSRYEVTFDEGDRRVARVRLDLPSARGELQLGMSSGASHVARGYAHFVRGISATDADGKALAVEELEQNGFAVALDGRPVTVRYEVALEHDAKPWPEGGPDEGPYATAEDAFWTGRALFLFADFDAVEVAFDLPRGWNVSTAWDPVPGRSDAFTVASPRELTESFLLAGTHAQHRVESGDTRILLAVGRGLDGGEALRGAVQDLLSAGRALFGATPPGRKLLVANRGPGQGLNGGVFGNSISLLLEGPFDAGARGQWAPFVAHEVLHLWNGGAGLRSRERDYWFSEGFTEYYAYVSCARLGLIDRDAFVARVGEACQDYLTYAGSVALRDAAKPGSDVRALQYDGGMLAALVLDLRLRRRDPGHGLDDLMRGLFARYAREPYSAEDVAAAAARQAGDDLDGYFEKYVFGTQVLPLAEELARAGLALASEVKATALARDYAIHEVLRIRSLTQTPDGLVVRRSAEAGYQDGDRLVAIEGRAVRTFADLQSVLADARPGATVSLSLRRGTDALELPLSLGGREDPPLQRTVDVRLSLEGDTSVLDRILHA